MPSFVVAAIDFGTTFSGYAFSFLYEYTNDPFKISTTTWPAGSGCLESLKTSTCVLYDPDKKFDSFGYEAEEKYSNLALEDKHHEWFYFSRFKMMLYNKKVKFYSVFKVLLRCQNNFFIVNFKGFWLTCGESLSELF